MIKVEGKGEGKEGVGEKPSTGSVYPLVYKGRRASLHVCVARAIKVENSITTVPPDSSNDSTEPIDSP